MKPLIHFALPWTFVVIAGLIRLFQPRRRASKGFDPAMVKLGLGVALPTILFWCLWSYKGQNYNLPTLPALFLFAFACFNGNLPRWSLRAAGVLGLVTFFVALGIVLHFWPLPHWWSRVWLVLALGSMLAFALIFILSDDARAVTVGTVAFFVAFGAFISPLGEREMVDMHHYVADNPDVVYYYCNLDPSIWNEWALLQLTLHHEIFGLHRESQLPEATKPGHAIIVQNTEWLNRILDYWKKNVHSGQHPIVTPWTRWLTKGRTPDGKSQWTIAWEMRDLRQLERQFFIIRFP